MDTVDQQIIDFLKKDSQLTHKKIGEMIHMTGQAVGSRINKLIDSGYIKHYTICITHDHQQFIRIFMDNNDYSHVESTVNTFTEIEHFYKVSGQACYMIVSHFSTDTLKQFIATISKWGRYTIETVMADKKTPNDDVFCNI